MDIVVCVKTNPDLQMVRIKDREPVLEAVPFKVGDLEKNALEAALQLRDAAGGGTITARRPSSEGDRKIRETMKEALAIGADEAVIVADDGLTGADQARRRPGAGEGGREGRTVRPAALRRGLERRLLGAGPGPRRRAARPARDRLRAQARGRRGAGLRAERSMGDVVEVLEAPLPVVGRRSSARSTSRASRR